MPLTAATAAIIAAGLSAGGALGASAINKRAQEKQNRQNYLYNKRLAEEAYNRNIKQWNAENFYNSPSAQMARYRAAGVNPNVLYGEAQDISSGRSDAAPEMSYPAYQGKAPVFDAQTPINAMLSPFQMLNLTTRSAKDLADVDFIGEKKKTEMLYRPFLLTEAQSRIDLNNEKASWQREQVEIAKLDRYIKDKAKDAIADSYEINNIEAISRVELNDSASRLKEKQILKIDKEMKKYDAEIRLINAEALKVQREAGELMDSIISFNKARSQDATGNYLKSIQQAIGQYQENAVFSTKFEHMMAQVDARTDLDNAEKEYLKKKIQFEAFKGVNRFNINIGGGAGNGSPFPSVQPM